MKASGIGGTLSDGQDARRQALADFGRTSVRWLGYAIPAVIVPLILGYLIKDKTGNPVLSAFEQMVIGALLFIIITLSALTQDLSVISRRVDERTRAARIERAVDAKLGNIKISYLALLERSEYKENLYAQIFDSAIEDLERTIHSAASEQTLPVDHYTFSTSQKTSAIIELRNRDILKLVHYFDDQFVFTAQGQDYYKRISGMCCNGQVQLRRLCIYSDPNQLDDAFAKRLFEYHARNRNHAYRVLSSDAWTSVLNDAEIREQGDMGIWGDLICYRSPKPDAANTEGVYSVDPRTIAKLSAVFDRGWAYADSPVTSSAGPMTVYELAHGSLPPTSMVDRELAVVGGKVHKKDLQP